MTDKTTIRMIIAAVSLFAIGSLAGLIWLISSAKNGTDIAVLGLVGTPMGVALGGLCSMLVSTRSSEDPPQPVHITNPPDDPAQVEEVP